MPSLAEAIRDARRKQEQREAPYQQRMQRLYAQVITNLEGDMQLLAMRIDQARIAGEDVNPDWLRRQSRYSQLLADADREFARFAQQGEYVLQDAKVQAVRGGAAEAWELMDASGITSDLTGGRINVLAVQDALAATESVPIKAILASYGTQGAKTIEDTLLDGIARGRSPRAIIRDIRKGLTTPHNAARLEALVRTESMRAYRGSLNQQYAKMDHLIQGYRWSSAKSTRTCLACLGRDGQISPTPWDTFHVSCRCVSTPVPKGSTYKYTTGEEWLRNQSPEVQAKMFPSSDALRAWKSGDVGLSDFVGHHDSPIYGRSVYQRSGRQVLERATPKVPTIKKASIPDGGFSDKDEAQRWFESKGISADFTDGQDMDIVNGVARGVQREAGLGQATPKSMRFIDSNYSSEFAAYNFDDGSMTFYNNNIRGDAMAELLQVEDERRDQGLSPWGYASRSIEDMFTHENAHYLHHQRAANFAPGQNEYELTLQNGETLGFDSWGYFRPASDTPIIEKVSQYGQMSPIEYVAEVYTGARQGITFSDDVLDLYRRLDGPPLDNT